MRLWDALALHFWCLVHQWDHPIYLIHHNLRRWSFHSNRIKVYVMIARSWIHVLNLWSFWSGDFKSNRRTLQLMRRVVVGTWSWISRNQLRIVLLELFLRPGEANWRAFRHYRLMVYFVIRWSWFDSVYFAESRPLFKLNRRWPHFKLKTIVSISAWSRCSIQLNWHSILVRTCIWDDCWALRFVSRFFHRHCVVRAWSNMRWAYWIMLWIFKESVANAVKAIP